VDFSRGIVGVAVSDCVNWYASGVGLSITPSDTQTRVFYFAGTSISGTADSTDLTGAALIVNVPVDAGAIKVTATPKTLGRPSSVVQGLVQAGTVTLIVTSVNQ
jgi:hypothetical protein